MDSAMNTVLGRGSAMSANGRTMKDALMPVRLHRSNSLRIVWENLSIAAGNTDTSDRDRTATPLFALSKKGWSLSR
jgi:hypothetical protein